jgi:hypothetical protein
VGDLVVKLVAPGQAQVPVLSRAGAAEARDKGDDAPLGDGSDLVASRAITFADDAPQSAERMGVGLDDARAICRDDGACRFWPAQGAAAGLNKLGALAGRRGTNACDCSFGPGPSRSRADRDAVPAGEVCRAPGTPPLARSFNDGTSGGGPSLPAVETGKGKRGSSDASSRGLRTLAPPPKAIRGTSARAGPPPGERDGCSRSHLQR